MDDDVYKDRQDQTVTVAFRLTADTALGADEKVAAETRRRRSTRMDHHPLDPAHQPGARRRTRD